MRPGEGAPELRALVIMHVENEGPGVFGDLLEAAGTRGPDRPAAPRGRAPRRRGDRRRPLDGRADERLRGGALPVPARRDALSAGCGRARPAGARHLPRRPDDREGRRRGGDEEPRRGGRLENGEPDRRGTWPTRSFAACRRRCRSSSGTATPSRIPAGAPCSRPGTTATTRPCASGARTACSSTSRRTARCSREWFAGKPAGRGNPAPLRRTRPCGRPLCAHPLRELPRDRPAGPDSPAALPPREYRAANCRVATARRSPAAHPGLLEGRTGCSKDQGGGRARTLSRIEAQRFAIPLPGLLPAPPRRRGRRRG